MVSLETLESEDDRILADEKKRKLEGKSNETKRRRDVPTKRDTRRNQKNERKNETYSQKTKEKMDK